VALLRVSCLLVFRFPPPSVMFRDHISFIYHRRYMILATNSVVKQNTSLSVISGFRRDTDQTCSLRRYYAAANDNPLLMFRGQLVLIFKGQEVQEETTVKDYHSTLRNAPEERGSQFPLLYAAPLPSNNIFTVTTVRNFIKSDCRVQHMLGEERQSV
jgi:hypothetical protein